MLKKISIAHILLSLSIYYVVMDQIRFSRESVEGTELRQHRKEKEQLQNKIHYYEIQKLKEHSIVDNATNDELDSLESVYQP